MTTKSLKQQIKEEMKELKKLNPKGCYYLKIDNWKDNSIKDSAKYGVLQAQLQLLDKVKEIIETKIESNEKRDISEVMKQNVKWELEELKTALIGEDNGK